MASRFEPQAWQIPGQSSWDQPPSSSGAGSPMQSGDDNAFQSQVEEVERARENLIQSGKTFGGPRGAPMSMLGGTRPYPDFDPTMPGMSPRHSFGSFEHLRPQSGSSLQNFYANQRQQPRQNDADQMMQAKRRMAAQRERELRNYHQEQQYNRNASVQGKSDRAISPNTMNEEDRRELIARQHRALYGSEGAPMYEGANLGENQGARPAQPGGGNGGRGPSPRTFDPFNRGQNQPQSAVGDPAGHFNSNEQGQQAITGPSPNPPQQRSRANSNSSPASNQQGGFSLFDGNAQQQSSRTSTSSPGESSSQQAKTSVAPTSAGVAPIGTRPAQQAQAANPALNKRSTTPLPSPLSYGFAPTEGSQTTSANNERSTSAASNSNPNPSPNPPAGASKEAGVGMTWGSGSGAWGKNPLGVQASVWG